MADALPSYDRLPIDPSKPPGSAWGVWGDTDVFGCLNLLTPERVQAGVACARENLGRALIAVLVRLVRALDRQPDVARLAIG